MILWTAHRFIRYSLRLFVSVLFANVNASLGYFSFILYRLISIVKEGFELKTAKISQFRLVHSKFEFWKIILHNLFTPLTSLGAVGLKAIVHVFYAVTPALIFLEPTTGNDPASSFKHFQPLPRKMEGMSIFQNPSTRRELISIFGASTSPPHKFRFEKNTPTRFFESHIR